MVLTQSPRLAERIKTLSLHGLSHDAWHRFSDSGCRHYTAVDCGYKYNMTDLQAAIGIHQLRRIESSAARRKEIWEQYQSRLRHLGIGLPSDVEEGTVHARHLYTIRVSPARSGMERDDFLEAMHERGIGCGVHYLSIPEHPYYRERYGWHPEEWPEAYAYGRETVSRPLTSWLTERDVDRIISAVEEIIAGSRCRG